MNNDIKRDDRGLIPFVTSSKGVRVRGVDRDHWGLVVRYYVVATTRSGWNGAETVRVVARNLTQKQAERERAAFARGGYRDTTYSVEPS